MNKAKKTLIALLVGITTLAPKAVKAMGPLEFSLGYGMQFNSQSPAKDYIDNVNNDFRTGKYTFTTPVPQFKNISVSNPNEFPLEGTIFYKLGKKIKLGVSVAVSNSKIESNYNETTPTQSNTMHNFDRKENIDIKSNSKGIKLKADLAKWLAVSLSGKQDNYDISGNVNYTMHNDKFNYTQNRTAEYNGTGTGSTIEAGIELSKTKNVSIGIFAGQKSGKVQTKGEQVITSNSWPAGTKYTYDYSPEFNFNSTYGKIEAKVKF